MIRINLLPHKTVRKKKTPGMGALVAIILCALAALAANYIYYSSKQEKIKAQKRTLAKQQTDINELKNAIGKVENFQAEKQKIEEQLKVLHDLEQGRSGPVKMLDALASAVPRNVWLTSINEKDGGLTISAEALSNEDVSSFMRMLKESVWSPVGIGRIISDQSSQESPVQRIELLPSGERREFPKEKLSNFFSDINLTRTSMASDTVSFSITVKVNNAI